MQLTPRYSAPPIINVDAIVPDPCTPLVRQRARLAEELSHLSADEWRAPSRCEGWTVQDVAEHLAGVNPFWSLSVRAGVHGEPTRYLANFDPVTVPAGMVDAVRGDPPSATLDRLVTSNAELASLLESLTDADWSMPAEAPPGHIAIRAVAAHALWDAWVHERDVLLPLSRAQVIEADEVVMSLAYAAAIGPALDRSGGDVAAAPSGSIVVIAHDPETRFTVDVGSEIAVRPGADGSATATIEGNAVELIDSLTLRGPAVALAEEHRWLIGGLSQAFSK